MTDPKPSTSQDLPAIDPSQTSSKNPPNSSQTSHKLPTNFSTILSLHPADHESWETCKCLTAEMIRGQAKTVPESVPTTVTESVHLSNDEKRDEKDQESEDITQTLEYQHEVLKNRHKIINEENESLRNALLVEYQSRTSDAKKLVNDVANGRYIPSARPSLEFHEDGRVTINPEAYEERVGIEYKAITECSVDELMKQRQELKSIAIGVKIREHAVHLKIQDLILKADKAERDRIKEIDKQYKVKEENERNPESAKPRMSKADKMIQGLADKLGISFAEAKKMAEED